MFINWSLTKEGRYCVTFLNAFMEYCKKMSGGTKQEMMSRFMLIGMMSDPVTQDMFQRFVEGYFSEEHPYSGEDGEYLEYVRCLMAKPVG